MTRTRIIFVVLVVAATVAVGLSVHHSAGPRSAQANVRELLDAFA